LTDGGRAGRQAIEAATSAQERPIIDRLGDERTDEVVETLRPWARTIVAAGVEGGGYPGRVADVAKMRSTTTT
jgi:hypothetical protein